MRRRTLALLVAAPLLLGAVPQGKAKANGQATASVRIDDLRKRCYGGRTEKGSPLLVDQLKRRVVGALAKEDHAQVAQLARRLLQAGGDEAEYVLPYVIAVEAAEGALPAGMREACQALVNAAEAKKSESP